MASDGDHEMKSVELPVSDSETRKRPLSDHDSDDDVINGLKPPKKKAKLNNNNAFSFLMNTRVPQPKRKIPTNKKKKKKAKKKKPIKDCGKKSIEQKYLNLDEKASLLLLSNIGGDQWTTIAELAGFNEKEINMLKIHLSAYMYDIKDDHEIIFMENPPDYMPRDIKQLWNRGSLTYKSINKRLQLIQLCRMADIPVKQALYTKITTVKLKVIKELLEIKRDLNKPSIKTKSDKLLSINDTIKDIKSKSNKKSQMRLLCDNVLLIKKQLQLKINQLNKLKNEILYLLQFNLKLIKIDNNNRIIHLKHTFNIEELVNTDNINEKEETLLLHKPKNDQLSKMPLQFRTAFLRFQLRMRNC